jgi:4-amino-4-deoxy-L-arabinose transferase-like glycosyltransferase
MSTDALRGRGEGAAQNTSSPTPEAKSPQAAWWREWQLWLLVVMTAAIYTSRISDLSVRGEEPRRARVAVEMIESGDWIVPRQQGAPFLSRPPLQNWLIGGIGLVRGEVDEVAIRLPSIAAIVLLVLVVYGYSRTFLTPLGAMAAAASFATMGQVLELGRLGETEALFTFLVSGSLLIWHYGLVRRWRPTVMWVTAYVLVGLAVLAKGPQAPVYFGASVGVYLLLTGRWRMAFAPAHFIGILAFVLVWGAWQVPFTRAMGLEASRAIFTGDVALRFVDTRWSTILEHIAVYPIELLFGCLLPWSILLLAYTNREFRRQIGPAGDHVRFLVVCLLVTFPTCWLVPGARTRYFMPLYPCFAPLIGLAVQRCWEASPEVSYRKLWPRFVGVVAGIMMIAGLVVTGLSVLDPTSPVTQPLGFAYAYLGLALVLGAAAFWSRRAENGLKQAVGVLAIASFLGVSSSGVVVNALIRASEDTERDVARLREQLPADVELVSYGQVDHVFAYYWKKPIRLMPWPEDGTVAEPPTSTAYFCSGSCSLRPVDVGFTWQKMGEISCERERKPDPVRTVVVGRSLNRQQTARTGRGPKLR